MDSGIISALGLLITLLLLLRARSRKKAEEQKNDQSIPPYEPIEPESRKLIDQTVTVISRASLIYNIAMCLLLLTVLA